MVSPENDKVDAFSHIDGHFCAQFSQAGSIEDLSLTQLRDHIKKVMIPLLIKSFQLKLELSQAISLPSRLQPLKQKQSSEEIIQQLKQFIFFGMIRACRITRCRPYSLVFFLYKIFVA